MNQRYIEKKIIIDYFNEQFYMRGLLFVVDWFDLEFFVWFFVGLKFW